MTASRGARPRGARDLELEGGDDERFRAAILVVDTATRLGAGMPWELSRYSVITQLATGLQHDFSEGRFRTLFDKLLNTVASHEHADQAQHLALLAAAIEGRYSGSTGTASDATMRHQSILHFDRRLRVAQGRFPPLDSSHLPAPKPPSETWQALTREATRELEKRFPVAPST